RETPAGWSIDRTQGGKAPAAPFRLRGPRSGGFARVDFGGAALRERPRSESSGVTPDTAFLGRSWTVCGRSTGRRANCEVKASHTYAHYQIAVPSICDACIAIS